LKDSVIIIDEAHNFVPAINGAHSVVLPRGGLKQACELLGHYLNKLQSRLGCAKASTATSLKGVAERLLAYLGRVHDDVRSRTFCTVGSACLGLRGPFKPRKR
jgi:Rad3-related DNA helicase